MGETRFHDVALEFAAGVNAQAQQATKIPRIGFLSTTSLAVVSARVEAFQQGLRNLGYVEGKNIVVEWRSAEGKADRLPELAAELVRLNVEILSRSARRIPRLSRKRLT